MMIKLEGLSRKKNFLKQQSYHSSPKSHKSLFFSWSMSQKFNIFLSKSPVAQFFNQFTRLFQVYIYLLLHIIYNYILEGIRLPILNYNILKCLHLKQFFFSDYCCKKHSSIDKLKAFVVQELFRQNDIEVTEKSVTFN